MQANEARRRPAGLHAPIGSRSPFGASGSGDGHSFGGSDKRGRRGGAKAHQGSMSVFWTLLLGLFGVLLLWMTWRLGASVYVSLPRLLAQVHDGHQQQAAYTPNGEDLSPCQLEDGHIVPAQGPCSIQAYLHIHEALHGALSQNEAPDATEGPAGDAPPQEAGDEQIRQQDYHAPVDDAEETGPADHALATKDASVELHLPEPAEAAGEQQKRHQRSHRRPNKTDVDPNDVPDARYQQTEREKHEQEQREQEEKTQKDMERRFEQKKKAHADTNRKRAAMGLAPLPPLRAPWEVHPDNRRAGPQQMPQDPRGEPEMTPDDFAWVSQMSIVISWVNGSEPEYAKKRAQFGNDKINTSRDRDSGELLHALQSIERYMAWHTGKIFIVSPNQKPSWLDTRHPRIKVIDQDDLVPKECQPTFSSNVLEQHLHRIPGLTETFIYWNDDYFLGRSVMPEDFIRFDKGGPRRLKLFMLPGRIGGGAAQVQAAANGPRKWYATLYHTNGILSEAYGGHDPGRTHIAHAPYVFHKRAYEKIHEKWAKELNHTCHNKFRNWSDVLFPYMHHYYVIHEGSKCCGIHYQINTFAHQGKEEFKFVILNNDKTKNKLALQDLQMTRPKFFTLNDGFRNPEVGFGQLTPFLARMSYGYRSSFERLNPHGDNRPGHEYQNYIARAQNYHKGWLAHRPNRTATRNRTAAETMAHRGPVIDERRQEIPGNGQGNQKMQQAQRMRRFEMMKRAQARMQQANMQQEQKDPGRRQMHSMGDLGPDGGAHRQQQQHPNHALRKGRAFQGQQQHRQQPNKIYNSNLQGQGRVGQGPRGMGPGGTRQQPKERPDQRFSRP